MDGVTLSSACRTGGHFSLGASFRLAFPTSILSLSKDAFSDLKMAVFQAVTLRQAQGDYGLGRCHHLCQAASEL